jgi:alkanesulfonate monooxygenase SsuD/methylene tetrahydromethanopterin reductase-like flavin-dependent oxidoreductase (luciferase family)
VAVQRREAIPYVARRGTSLALIPYATVRDRRELADQIREFRAALPSGSTAEVAAALHVYAGAHPERARRAFGEYLESRLRSQSTHLRAKAARDPHHATPEALEAAGLAVFGPPDHVVREMRGVAECGVDEVLGIFDFGGLPLSDALASIRAVGPSFANGRP